jgi:hypothetical protein
MNTLMSRLQCAGAALLFALSSAWAADAPQRGPGAGQGGCQMMQGMMGDMGGMMGHMSRQRMMPGSEGQMAGHMNRMGGMMGDVSKMMEGCANMSEADRTRMSEMQREMRELRLRIGPPPATGRNTP